MAVPVLLEPAELDALRQQADILLLDLSSAEHYQQGHVPGAIHMPSDWLLHGQPPVANYVPTLDQLSERFASLGLQPHHWVVAYDDQMGPWAGRLLWTLHLLGHQRVSVLNGHLPAWQAAGFAIEQQVNPPQRSDYQAQWQGSQRITLDELLQHHQDLRIWDARSQAEYRGEKIVNAHKGGHIPGAIWLEWTELLESPQIPRLKPLAELQRLLHERGLRAEHSIVTHCQTHRRSGLTYLAACALGYPRIQCYDGSWFEWGNHPDTPVSQGDV
ncbi:sulfurtransferase [Balneatrix alpica]|uniref:Sulfurtransferase n=1 Tax=Balneatrix alpica TaxID=75684 RepID=A0ABV5ZB56_9GAMM|nr:sulfurtransferase [Balneatrix alpica]